ncbi:MAG: M23 family metallopeptidase [Barnesiella sp.]|nr:M23 family metallopeptidase [Barnesiella sp.]
MIKAYNPKEGHFGIDIQCPRNTAVSAVLDGTIVSAGYTIDYGYVIYIQHSNNYLSVYKYNSGILKNIGDKVSGGEKIAVTGWEDGKSSKQSCVAEFQLWHMGQSLDPEKYITF